jgi:hypothetical protein
MSIIALRTATPDDEQVEVVGVTSQGHAVLAGEHISFASLEDAINALKQTIAEDESNKLKMARIVRAIEAQQLYLQIPGCLSFKAFLPMLLERTASVGWKSATTIKRYLAFVKLYLEQLDFDADQAIRTVSHLFELQRIVSLDRKTGSLAEPKKDDKLGPVAFEDVARLVIQMVTGFTRDQMVSGLDEAQTAEVLAAAGMTAQAGTYHEIMGEDIKMPPKGWSVTDTQRIVEKLAGKEEADDDDAEVDEVHRVWVGYVEFSGAVMVERIEFRRGEVKLNEIEVNKTFSSIEFEVLRGKDAKQIAGDDGEQAIEE